MISSENLEDSRISTNLKALFESGASNRVFTVSLCKGRTWRLPMRCFEIIGNSLVWQVAGSNTRNFPRPLAVVTSAPWPDQRFGANLPTRLSMV